jgi:hypothetical protein
MSKRTTASKRRKRDEEVEQVADEGVGSDLGALGEDAQDDDEVVRDGFVLE